MKNNKSKIGYGTAATYFILPSLQLKASFEQAYRMPEAVEIFGDGFIQKANPDLRPEISRNLNIGLLFDQLKIDKSVAEREDEPEVTKEGNRTIYTYVYKYDGCAFYIEADAQAIQAHNAQEAIESQWCQDIAAVYDLDSDSGSLSLK